MTMKIILSSTLRRYVTDYDPEEGLDVTLDEGHSVAELCRLMGIPTKEIKVVMINGRNGSLDHILRGDERIGLFPAVGGG